MIEHHMRAKEGEVLLFDPEHISLTYGAADDIKFGPKGNAEDHFALVPEDHPLLGDLLKDYPLIVLIDEGAPQVFMCPACTPTSEWKSRVAYNSHYRQAHKPVVVQA
jgi:hypothetical protein